MSSPATPVLKAGCSAMHERSAAYIVSSSIEDGGPWYFAIVTIVPKRPKDSLAIDFFSLWPAHSVSFSFCRVLSYVHLLIGSCCLLVATSLVLEKQECVLQS